MAKRPNKTLKFTSDVKGTQRSYAMAVDTFFKGYKDKDGQFRIYTKDEERTLVKEYCKNVKPYVEVLKVFYGEIKKELQKRKIKSFEEFLRKSIVGERPQMNAVRSEAFDNYKELRQTFENELVTHNIFLAVNFASKYQKLYDDYDELLSAAMNGLVEAATKFDENSGYRFNTYAVWWILNHITKPIRAKGEYELMRRTTLRFDDLADQTGSDSDADYPYATMFRSIEPSELDRYEANCPVDEIQRDEREYRIKEFADNLVKSVAASSLSQTDKSIFNMLYVEHETVGTISKFLKIPKSRVNDGRDRVISYINANFSANEVLA